MDHRNEISEKLHTLPVNDEIHFQPPEDVKLVYPCIIYSFDGFRTFHGNDGKYLLREEYTVTHIYQDPIEELHSTILSLFNYVSYDRGYIADNLYHDVYSVFA